MTVDEKDLMTLAYDERRDLAAFLASLTPQEWQAQSLCEAWTVKDVVAHVVSYEELIVVRCGEAVRERSVRGCERDRCSGIRADVPRTSC